MDWALVFQAAPQYAMAGWLIFLMTRLMGHATTDRGDYRADLDAAEQRYTAAIAAAEARHAAEMTRLRETHAHDLDALRAELADMRGRFTDVTRQLDDERRARWHAEDVAADARRLAGAVTHDPHSDGG